MDKEIIERSKEILKLTDGKICKNCFGRKISDIFDGDGNVDRAEKISKYLGIDLNNSECSICDNIFLKIDDNLVNKVKEKINFLNLEFETFLVGTRVSKELMNKDEEISNTLNSDVENIKKEINREIGKLLESSINKEVDFERQDVVINVDFRKDLKVRIQINPIFIEGKYNKYIRGIPQTKWPCSKCKGRGCEQCNYTGKQYLESVEELLSERFLEETKGYEAKFHGAGREDIDVLMLGSGRPFVLEIKEPKIRNLDLNKLENEVNKLNKGKTAYHGLKFVERNRKAEIKVSSPDTYKVYNAYVKTSGKYDKSKLDDLYNLNKIEQETPTRVLRRRADKTRIKHVKDLKIEIIDSDKFKMTVKTDGGLYIKELISGDDGRTNPNVSKILGIDAFCEKLDVVEVSEK